MLSMRRLLLGVFWSAFALILLFADNKTAALTNWSKRLSLKIALCTQPHYTQILPGLYLSNARAACDSTVLRDLHITHILTVETHRPQPRDDIAHLFIRAYDIPSTNLLPYFPMANAFIEEGIQKGSVIVHCHFGVSRSATLVIAYVMQKHHMTYDEALDFVRSKRRFINPNPGFVEQLKEYQRRNYQVAGIQRFEAYVSVNARKHRFKIASLAAVLLGVIVPVVFLLA